ncbi:hypothetical protein EV421DRAFT_1837230, partial [Armillaria borealis]
MSALASESMLVSASMALAVYSLSIGPRCHAVFNAYSSLQVTINEELSTRTKMGGIRDIAQRPAFVLGRTFSLVYGR